MSLLKIGCKTMREGVIVSTIFFFAGVLMIMTGLKIVPDIFYMQQIVMFAGLLLLLFAPLILITTFLLTVLPGAKEKMDKCEH
ncbi:MAG: hypothetical protein JMN27_17170 [gamma proteobacterium endosymbiont of Lamellibrachia anaximandri]|uniref:Uncharacterized protein n=1 Tax=endosymbiont of Escarpia spicata TaxID=2200908 RepID=A0A370DSK0_9GAMM|nr:hypothetical protein [Gammaproteobacteria bacterium]MBL3529367.1 hypothetical protein [gamma proteobacterium endosymbiont of Lamellibrachia anaximandri]RDH88144.1 MAG: hypothetical protein DIZ78_01775 [endosymbiont of Escarpia spicata]MBL3535538.1 hypothetical protein [gamma proteobacterium endosymbiont of Lamellibrachia anaximandri]MBL3590243.1 hypothetical protein [gamma proteobacterium endosymbiont of Lamellibrachia anaximandri]